MYSKEEKKQFAVFLLISYGITFALGILMWYGNENGIDVSSFPNAQMLYPAAGVMTAYLLTGKGEKDLIRGFYGAFLVITLVMIVVAVLSVIFPNNLEIVGQSFSLWMMVSQYIIILGSIICWIFLGVGGKKKRAACGLRWKNTKVSFFCVFLFLVLYTLRMTVAYVLGGEFSVLSALVKNPTTWINFVMLIPNFFLVFVAFFGEEYGWRYYMQPFLQKKFGLRGGVLLLGVFWGLWHLPIDFFYYTSPEMGLIAAVSQQITCITLGIFFAYAYMKTDNIWVPTILHYFNNNLVPVFSGDYSVDVLQNQQMSWSQLPLSLLMGIIFFGLFIFGKPFHKKKEELDRMESYNE